MEEKKRLFVPPKGSYFLFGPRGTGKSTWLHHNYPDAFYIDLLTGEALRAYSAYPERLQQQLDAMPHIDTVVIDEIQRVPELLSTVHHLIEKKKQIQFILTGSSARKLKRAGVDLLAGRAIKREMHPFIASELGAAFELDVALERGMLPLVWGSPDPNEVLDTYIDLYIHEEVQFEGLVRHIGSFTRFLSIIAFSHAQILNITNIARECEVKRHLVENYLEILQDLLLAYTIPIFTKRARREMVSHPKFYLFDAGIFRAMRAAGPLDSMQEIGGATLEGLVLQHLKAWCDYTSEKHEIFYWRTKAGLEVDFVVYGKRGLWAIEVKSSSKICTKDLRSLKHFKEDYPEATCYLLYRGKEQLMLEGIECIPCETFLTSARLL